MMVMVMVMGGRRCGLVQLSVRFVRDGDVDALLAMGADEDEDVPEEPDEDCQRLDLRVEARGVAARAAEPEPREMMPVREGDYLVVVHVIELRDLYKKLNDHSSADPVVTVEVEAQPSSLASLPSCIARVCPGSLARGRFPRYCYRTGVLSCLR